MEKDCNPDQVLEEDRTFYPDQKEGFAYKSNIITNILKILDVPVNYMDGILAQGSELLFEYEFTFHDNMCKSIVERLSHLMGGL